MVTGERGALVLREMGVPIGKVVNFPYWVPIPPREMIKEWHAKCSQKEGPVRFIGIGRLERIKRYDLAISAFERVVAELGAGSATLTIVGAGSEKARLRDLAKNAGVAQWVEFCGWQEHGASMGLLEQSDVLVHPAEWEPYGVVVLEAMARGKPVIASDMTMAAIDRVAQGVSGFICKTGDMEEMVGCMKRLVLDRPRMIEMGYQARSVAEAWHVSRAVDIVKQLMCMQTESTSEQDFGCR